MERPSILIVDDERNIRLTLCAALESLDVEVETAVNGQDALAKLGERGFDIVLLDLRMPGMDGMTVLDRIRRGHPRAAVAILTAHGSIESAVKAMKLGAADFLQKPFTPVEIRELVSDLLTHRQVDQHVPELSFEQHVDEVRRALRDQASARALEHARRALSLRPDSAEVFNLLGAASELQRQPEKARKYYHTATTLDPTYKPAERNLDRLVRRTSGTLELGEINEMLG